MHGVASWTYHCRWVAIFLSYSLAGKLGAIFLLQAAAEGRANDHALGRVSNAMSWTQRCQAIV
jgi:hypothetical protein